MPNIVAQAWLRGHRDYQAGLQILRDNNTSAFVVELLESGPDDYNTPKLADLITQIANNNQVKPAATPAPAIAAAASDHQLIRADDHDLQKTIDLKNRIKTLFVEIGHLRGKLSVLPEGDELYKVAKEVLFKDLKRQDLWDQLHYFEMHDEWFDERPGQQKKELDIKDPAQLERKIKNLMANRSKKLAELKKPLPAVKVRFYEDKVASLTKEIETLQAYRNG